MATSKKKPIKSKAKPKKVGPKKKSINLALQGGGSHGAFTWGVLDELLRDGRLDFDSITATSAGSMNAAIMLYGLHRNGADGARDLLEKFWRRVSDEGKCFNPLGDITAKSEKYFSKYMDIFFPWASDFAPKNFLNNAAGLNYLENIGQTISPYKANPLNINPLRDILNEIIDFKEMPKCTEGKLFISATNVRIGESRVFKNEEITEDVIIASASLPYLFHAVEIDGDYYWDGGYTGNPALWPLFYESQTRDLLIVHVNPILRPELPKEAYEIENRINEVTFNSSLLNELRAIQFVQKLLEKKMLKEQFRDEYKNIRLHAIRSEDTMRAAGISSKYDTSWTFLTSVRDAGRKVAADWLKKNFDAIGKAGTVDIRADYLEPEKKINRKMVKKKTE